VIRFLITALIWFLAAAIGLLAAELLLDGMSIDFWSYLEVVVVFAVLQGVLTPFIMKMGLKSAPALLSAAGLASTFIALLITDVVSSGLSITGVDTWVFASLIVWLASMLAAFTLPFLLARRAVSNVRSQRGAR
jgi:hypothetical protein